MSDEQKVLMVGDKQVEFIKLTIGKIPDIAIKIRKIKNMLSATEKDDGSFDVFMLMGECYVDILDVIQQTTNLSKEEIEAMDDISLLTEILSEVVSKNVDFFLGIFGIGMAISQNVKAIMPENG